MDLYVLELRALKWVQPWLSMKLKLSKLAMPRSTTKVQFSMPNSSRISVTVFSTVVLSLVVPLRTFQ